MHDSEVRSRLKTQLTKFSTELCNPLSKPLTKFVSEMLFGIQASQDVKLSNIIRKEYAKKMEHLAPVPRRQYGGTTPGLSHAHAGARHRGDRPWR